jgi:hypothetical protein
VSAARHAPATLRNRVPILDVLRAHLPARGLLLEVAAGTGEHAAFFAPALPHLTWQPTDPDPDQRASIAAWRVAGGEPPPPNLLPPLDLDVEREPWPVAAADAIVNINMIHIAPWSACERLMEGAARRLPAGGLLYLYGPFMRDGRHTADSNARFDESLRAQDPRWGVRDLAAVEHAAATHGLARREIIPMPANNLSVIFRRDR